MNRHSVTSPFHQLAFRLGPALVLSLLTGVALAESAGLSTGEKTIRSYAYGERVYKCLKIDGSIVPLVAPPGAKVDGEGELKVVWPEDRSFAIIRKATAAEVALFEDMDKPEAPKEWKDYLAATIKNESDQYSVRDFQPNILAVNHWRIGAISMDYSFAGVRSCALLLLWRTQDGTTITVTMRTGFSDFKSRCDQLYSMIGGAMMLKE